MKVMKLESSPAPHLPTIENLLELIGLSLVLLLAVFCGLWLASQSCVTDLKPINFETPIVPKTIYFV
eukprot:676145-Amphidinium_carterae.1